MLIGEHVPWLLELITPLVRRSVYDADHRKMPKDTLFVPGEGERERWGDGPPRETSIYTFGELHPLKTAGMVMALGAFVALGIGLTGQRR